MKNAKVKIRGKVTFTYFAFYILTFDFSLLFLEDSREYIL